MGMLFLTRRESSILNSIVINFVSSASPVGSNFLSKANKNRLSSATIRNVMMDLEKKGLVIQPHISAGRIPTDLGYRYYVNDLMTIKELSSSEKQKIQGDFEKISNKNVESILEKACGVLSEISNQLGVVLAPKFFQGIFKKLELVRLSEHKLLVVISVSSGFVKTIMIEIKNSIPVNKLEETERILNERLSGLSLRQIKDSIKKRMHDVSHGDENIINKFTESVDEIFSIDESENVHFKGTSNILAQPEFLNTERLSKILELIDNQEVFLHIIKSSTSKDDKISITIGKEHRQDLVKKCSLISTTYKIGDITGTLGVIGPTRMKYEKVASLVDYVAHGISNLFY